MHNTTSARPTEAFSEKAVERAPLSRLACAKWAQQLNGHLSFVTSSADGQRLLVTTSAEGRDEGRVRLFDGAGRVLWSQPLSQPAKSQAISEDGTLLAINTYDGKLHVYTASAKNGKTFVRKAWTTDHLGKVVIAENVKRIYLLNDDDSEPQSAFISYDYSGKNKVDVSLKDNAEPIDMFVSVDERYIVVALADRSIIAFDFLGKTLWRAKLDGDPVSIAPAGEEKNKHAYVLLSQPQGKGKSPRKRLVALMVGERGVDTAWEIPIDSPFETLQPVGQTIALYGNTYRGQALAGINAATGKELWRYTYPYPANYSSPVASDRQPEPHITVAIDDGTQAGLMRIFAINEVGTLLWETSVDAASGIYSFTTSSNGTAFAAGTGEPGKGKLSYYILPESPENCGESRRGRVVMKRHAIKRASKR